MKIIVADDDKFVRGSLVAIIGGVLPEAAVHQVDNGRKLVERTQGQTYDLVITDLNMPEMDGFQAIMRIRESGANMPIWMMSGNDVGEYALKAGANDFYRKGLLDETERLKKDLMRFAAIR